MFILEELVSAEGEDEKWVLYAKHNDCKLLNQMIQTKRKPERFRIIEREVYEPPKKNTRCLVFRIYDDCTAGRIEGALLDQGIEYTTENMEECIIFNVMRPSNLKWYQIKNLVKSIFPAKCYFTKINLEESQECA